MKVIDLRKARKEAKKAAKVKLGKTGSDDKVAVDAEDQASISGLSEGSAAEKAQPCEHPPPPLQRMGVASTGMPSAAGMSTSVDMAAAAEITLTSLPSLPFPGM